MKPHVAATLGTLLVVVGIALALVAWTNERLERRLRDGASHTTARVVAIVGRGPVVRFVTAGGDHVDVTVAVGTFSPRAAVGQDVQIYYHPDNPAFAGLDDPISRWSATAAGAGLGVLAVVLGAYTARASKRA